jgi:prophage tail gpP-like protein
MFQLINTISGQGNNVESGDEVDDISRRYSRITVISQVQGEDDFGMNAAKINVKATVTDDSFPFHKPFVTKLNNDSQSPKLYARMLLEKQRHDGYQLTYIAPGHSQNGINFKVNELAQVRDEMLGKNGIYLVYNRKLKRSKQQGSITELKLGPPGLVAV